MMVSTPPTKFSIFHYMHSSSGLYFKDSVLKFVFANLTLEASQGTLKFNYHTGYLWILLKHNSFF